MAALKRLLQGLIVVAGGVAAAVPFQRDHIPSATRRSAVESKVVWRRSDMLLQIRASEDLKAESTPVVRKVPQLRATPGQATLRADHIESEAARRESRIFDPARPDIPRLADSFEVIEQDPHKPPRIDKQASVDASSTPMNSRRRNRTEFDLRHVVQDGDSLRLLAERYLGSSDRWREIYDANRSILEDPEVLPPGIEVRVPSCREP